MRTITSSLIALLVAAAPLPVAAQGVPADLSKATIEELLQTTIVSASKKAQAAEDVAAAVTVITHDDIVRSGVETLPELFRLVPGMSVARIGASNWAISIRGFNDLLTDKVLVLVDGRSVFSRRFEGVFWDTEDLPLDDIERIEVVRGPGGALWGANTMNGVINIITRSAKDTTGVLVRSGVITGDGSQTAGRYGWSDGNLAMRVTSQWSSHPDGMLDRSTAATDGWRSLTNMFRLDWSSGKHEVTAEATYADGRPQPGWLQMTSLAPGAPVSFAGTADRSTMSALARWKYTGDEGVLQVQSFVSRLHLDEPIAEEIETDVDVDVQYQRSFGRHAVVMGAGLRDAIDDNARSSLSLSVTPAYERSTIVNSFAQDEITITPHLRASAGARVERDEVSGWSFQPSVRGIWLFGRAHQRIWGAVSRAVKPPAGFERDFRYNYYMLDTPGLPTLVSYLGNPAARSQYLVDVEGGYRVDLASRASLDVSLFRGSYSGLKTAEPLPPVFEATPGAPHILVATQAGNLLDAVTSGIELAVHWTPIDAWHFDGSYSGFHVTPSLDPSSHDATSATTDLQTPRHQWQLHSSLSIGARTELDLAAYRVGEVPSVAQPGYTRADVQIRRRLSDRWTLQISGRNLLTPARAEFPTPISGTTSTLVPRAGAAQLTWKF